LRVLLRLPGLVLDPLQVALQLADRQAGKRALVLVTLLEAFLTPVVPVGGLL
jgi:hypothetical protein